MADPYAPIAGLYDLVGPYRDRPDADFYVEAAVASGGPVLELGSGTGRVLIPTARAGVEVVGVDLSPAMLEVCRTRLLAEAPEVRARVRLIRDDIRTFELGERYRLITLPFRPFQHLTTVDDQLACLASVRRHLAEDGRLVFDLFNPSLEALVRDDLGREAGEEPEVVSPDGRRLIRRHRILARDFVNQITHVELIYLLTHPDGRQERLVHAFAMRYLFRFETEHLLARAGFEVDSLYGGFDKSAFGSSWPGEMIFVARAARG